MNFIKRLRDRRTARAAYFATDTQLGELSERLAATTDARERHKALRRMADLEMDQCRRYRAAFGRDVTDDGIGMADSLMYASMLYRVLSDVEHVVATNGRVGRNWRIRELGEAADEVLDRMAATSDLAGRTALLEDLRDAVHNRVGPQAAETLWCLPSPGHSGWLTIEAKDDWLAERGYGRPFVVSAALRRITGKG